MTWPARVAARTPSRVLEVAAGTGVVTRALADALARVDDDRRDRPQSRRCSRRPRRSAPRGRCNGARPTRCSCLSPTANSTSSSASSASCSSPTRRHAFAEARRVLRPGGAFVFNAWDRIEDNEFADVVTSSLASFFPADPPRFLARTPHGYHDRATIERDVRGAADSRSPVLIDTVAARSTAPTARHPAIAYCQGTPLAQRDRSARCGASRRSDRRRRRRDGAPLRLRAGRRQDPGARRRRRALSARVPVAAGPHRSPGPSSTAIATRAYHGPLHPGSGPGRRARRETT